jgi:hypothetical protein
MRNRFKGGFFQHGTQQSMAQAPSISHNRDSSRGFRRSSRCLWRIHRQRGHRNLQRDHGVIDSHHSAILSCLRYRLQLYGRQGRRCASDHRSEHDQYRSREDHHLSSADNPFGDKRDSSQLEHPRWNRNKISHSRAWTWRRGPRSRYFYSHHQYQCRHNNPSRRLGHILVTDDGEELYSFLSQRHSR